MSDLLAGFTIAERLHKLEIEFAAYRAGHESDPGAHAAAFNAHDMSPGVVEQAEELAAQITETAIDAAEALEDLTEDSLEAIADATEETADATEELVEDVAEAPAEAVEEASSEETPPDEPVKERAPKREHFLHRRWTLG